MQILSSTVQTTVVDVKKCKMYLKNFGEFYTNQVESAGAIILSRTDIADDAKVEQTVEMLRELNSEAPIITTPAEKIDGKKLFEIMEKHAPSLEKEMLEESVCEVCGGHHGPGHHHEHDHDHHHDHEHRHDHEHECGTSITTAMNAAMITIMTTDHGHQSPPPNADEVVRKHGAWRL